MMTFCLSILLIPIGGLLYKRPELITNHLYHWLFNIPYEEEQDTEE